MTCEQELGDNSMCRDGHEEEAVVDSAGLAVVTVEVFERIVFF